jgi:multiple sugar transport system substrate-binding protein
MTLFTRRRTLAAGAGALAAGTFLRNEPLWAQLPTKNVTPPDIKPESGASLRVIRPTKFFDADQVVFDENTKAFTEKTGIPVRVDYESWEDLRPKTAVAASIGSGGDIVLGWYDDAFQYEDRVIELNDIAEYIGEKHGGWWEMPAKYGLTDEGRWIGLPIGSGGGVINYRKSWLNEAGFETLPSDLPGFLKAAQALKAKGHPTGYALGNAVGDGNTWYWLLWGHGAAMVDKDNNVIIDSPETVAALEYAKEFYQTFTAGTLSWLDPSNNKAFLSGEIGLTHNGISLYYAAKNSQDPALQAIAADTFTQSPPIGPVGHPTEISPVITAFVFQHTKYPQAAKAYLMHMFETEPYTKWQEACIGYWQPTLKVYDSLPFWEEDKKLLPFRDICKNMLYVGYSGKLGAASASVASDYIMVQMFAAVCSGQSSPADAAAEAARRARRYYRT